MMATEKCVPESGCWVPLLDESEAFPRIRQVYRYEMEKSGRVRNLTRVTAHSSPVWLATTRALGIYDSLQCLDRPLVDLICLYTSLLNGCEYCIDDAAGEALESGWQADQLLALGQCHDRVYPTSTVVALRYAAVLTLDPHSVDEVLSHDLRQYYSVAAQLELSCVIGMKNFWNRFATGLLIPAEGKCADAKLMASLLELSRSIRTN